MRLEKFHDWPSDTVTKRFIYLGFIILWINWPMILYFMSVAHYPVTFLESQLSFSGAVIKSHFMVMSAGEIRYYVLYQSCDIVYDAAHILMFFGLSLFLARKFEKASRWRTVGVLIAFVGIIGSLSDVLENSIIIMMTTDPQNFPDIWAIAHSWLAALKFTLWGIQVVWILWADITLLKRGVLPKLPFFAALGVVICQHWPIPLTVLGLLVGE